MPERRERILLAMVAANHGDPRRKAGGARCPRTPSPEFTSGEATTGRYRALDPIAANRWLPRHEAGGGPMPERREIIFCLRMVAANHGDPRHEAGGAH